MRRLFRIWTLCALALSTAGRGAPTDAEPPLRQLTQTDFSSSVAHGLWLVEFFSPYCKHCNHFAPTWAQLVREKSSAALSFSMAQVNCVAQGDICAEQKIEYYPTINLYHNGTRVDTYNGDRSHDDLVQYIDEGITKYLSSKDELPREPEGDSGDAQKALGTRSVNTAGEVARLNNITEFDAALAEGPLFVKMFAPWCGHCKKLAPLWKQLAANMKGVLNVAEVDCEESAELCRREVVDGYPMIFFYQNGNRLDYRGGRKLPELEAYARRVTAAAAGLQVLDIKKLDDLVRSEPAFFIYLHNPASALEKIATDLVKKTVIKHAGGAPIYSSTSQVLFEEFSIGSKEPVVVSIKDHVREAAAVFFLAGVVESNNISTHVQDLDRFLLIHRFPSAFELSSSNFQEVMRGSTTDVVVIVPLTTSSFPGPKEAKSVLTAAKKLWVSRPNQPNGQTLPALFGWMDIDRWEEWLGSMYGFKKSAGDLARVVLADHKRLVYYDGENGEPIGLFEGEIVNALEAYANGAPLKHSEGWFSRKLRGLHNVFESLGEFLGHHFILAVVLVASVLALIFVILRRIIRADVRPYHDHGALRRGGDSRERRPLTSKSGRLD